MIKPLEKAAAQKGASLTLTCYGKIEAKGLAGKHDLGFEHPEGNPKHTPQDYILTTAKAGAKTTTSGNFFANLAICDGWAGPCGTMWRLTHDPVRHILHARKPFVINTENLSLKKGRCLCKSFGRRRVIRLPTIRAIPMPTVAV